MVWTSGIFDNHSQSPLPAEGLPFPHPFLAGELGGGQKIP
jgi:hypothetical protein